jgi:hypothetical protein
MVKRYAALALSASVLAACSSEPTAPGMAATSAPMLAKGVSSPNTPVGASFVVYAGGGTYYAGSGPSRNGQGECHTHTDGSVGWYWVPGNFSPGNHNGVSGPIEVGPNHAQCRFVSAGYEVRVTFTEIANYVKSTSGNFELNFDPHCVPNADPTLPPVCDQRYVHYQVNQDLTQGYGLLRGVGVRTDNGEVSHWTIDLSQIHSSSNLIGDPPRQLLLTAHCEDGSYPDSPATISW